MDLSGRQVGGDRRQMSPSRDETAAQPKRRTRRVPRTGVSDDDGAEDGSAGARRRPSAPASARRVVLKLSGEVFGGGEVGVDPDVVQGLARQIATVVRRGMQVAVVVGGGNFFRGAELQERGMDRPRADYMGMLGTVMNCLALQDFLEKEGIDTRVQTAISMAQVAEPYIPRRAIRHLEKGRVVIFGAGAGMPYFTTDTVAAQRALEIHADIVLMSKNGVDGVYTADPRTDPTRAQARHGHLRRGPAPRPQGRRRGRVQPVPWRTGCRCWCSAPRARTRSSGPSAASEIGTLITAASRAAGLNVS